MCQHCQLQEDEGFCFDIRHIQALRYTTDEDLPKLFHEWNYTMQGLTTPQPESNLAVWLFLLLKQSKALETDIKYYDRLRSDHPDKTYGFLYNIW